MAEANHYGIDVVEDFGSVNTFSNINNKARWKLFKVVGEDEDDEDEAKNEDIDQYFDGHTLIVRNKKTGTGFFAMFN
jgi:Mg2+/Co2+ transporter CorC